MDEDAAEEDGYEPNDATAWHIGTLEDEDSFTLEARLHNDEDVDLYEVSIEDGVTNLFTLEVAISDIPDEAVFELEVFWVDGAEVVSVESGTQSLGATVEDTSLVDESGDYQIAVRSLGGANCLESYTLQVDYLEWGW